MNALTLWTAIHGYLGVLAAVALLHPAILLRRGSPLSRGGRWSVVLTSVVTVLGFSLGILLYPSYREIVKRPLFTESFRAGLLFETKEHLAVMVVSLTIGATVAALLAPREARSIRRTAALLFAFAAFACLATASLGTYVSAIRSFAS
jgi:hypothetical protein